MTNREAIKTIEIAIAEVEWDYPMDYSIAFAQAISALKEREERQKGCSFCRGVSRISVKRTDYEWSISIRQLPDINFCPNCGAKMDGKAVE